MIPPHFSVNLNQVVTVSWIKIKNLIIYLPFHFSHIRNQNNNSGSMKKFRIQPDPDLQHWYA